MYSALSISVLFSFAYAVSKRSTFFQYYFFISIIHSSTGSNINCYISFNKYMCITLITQIDLSIAVLNLICLLEQYAPVMLSFISTQFFVLNLDGLFDSSFNKFAIFWYSIIILLY